MRTRFFVKWTFIFSILSIWSYFVVVNSLMSGFETPQEATFVSELASEHLPLNLYSANANDVNVPLYLLDSQGLHPATSSEIISLLFTKQFEIRRENKLVPTDACSLRARNGTLSVNNMNFNRNNLNLQISSTRSGKWTGHLTLQDDHDRFSLEFKVKEIVYDNGTTILFEAEGSGKLNKEKMNFESLMISYDSLHQIVSLNGAEGNNALSSDDLAVDFVEGCTVEKRDVYILDDNGELDNHRKVQQVRKILDEHPELLDRFEGLSRLYKDFWWLIVPTGLVS